MESAPAGLAEDAAEGIATDGIVSKGTLPEGAGAGAPGRDSGAFDSGAFDGGPGIEGGATDDASGGGAIDGAAGNSGGLCAGPKVGEVLNKLFDEVEDGKLRNDKKELLARAGKMK